MSSADLQPGVGIEGSLENQERQSDRRLQRVADYVLQHAVSFEPAGGAEFGGALRMDENQRAELFGLGPGWMKFRVRQLLAVDAAANQCAAQSELLDRIFELLGGEIRMLQSHGREADELVGLRRASLGEFLVLQLDHLTGEVGLGFVPKDRVDAERFNVDALLVHRLDAVWRDHERGLLHLQSHQRIRVGHLAMGVHVDGPNAFSVDYDLTTPLRGLRQSRGQQATSNEYRASQRTSRSAEHFPSVRHQHFPRCKPLFPAKKSKSFCRSCLARFR